MVNVKSTPVIMWGFSAMLTYLVAFPDFLDTDLYTGVTARATTFANVFAHITLDIFTTIMNVAALNRAINGFWSFARFPTNPTWFARMGSNLTNVYFLTRLRACFWNTPRGFFCKHSAAYDTGKMPFSRFPVAWLRAKLSVFSPVFLGTGATFEERFATMSTVF